MNRIKNLVLTMCAYWCAVADSFRSKKPQKKFVIFHTGKMGDLVCVTSLFRAVKESLPDYELVVYAPKPFGEIVKRNPYVTRIVEYRTRDLYSDFWWLLRTARDLRKHRPQYFVNLMGSFEANIVGIISGAIQRRCLATTYDSHLQKFTHHLVEPVLYRYDYLLKQCYLDLVRPWGVKPTDTRNQLFFDGQLEEAERFFGSHGVGDGDTMIGISVSSGKEFKRWPREHWVELITKLAQKYGAWIVFFGTSTERDEIEAVRKRVLAKSIVVDSVSLSALPYYLKRCNLFVSVDTGPLYIADALGVPVVDIMGPVDETQQRPEREYRLVTDRNVCRPILKTPAYPLTEQDYCDVESAFQAVSVDEVFEACWELLSKKKKEEAVVASH